MQIKRTLTFIEEIALDAGQRISPPLRKVAVAAIVDNPFAGRFERVLSPLTNASAELGQHICSLAIALLSPHKAESYGKAAIIG
jgi:amino acid synthesis protein